MSLLVWKLRRSLIGGVAAVFFCAMPGSAVAQDAPTLRVIDDTERGELVLELGPVDLPAGASHHEIAQPRGHIAELPIDGWLRGYSYEVVDGDGKPVPNHVLHHLNLIAPDRRELFSPIMMRIGAAGHETKPIKLPRLLGLRVRPGERIMVTAIFHNPTSESYSRVYLRTRMPYTRADTWLKPWSVYPFYMDVMPPASIHAYDLPPGRSEKSWEGRPAISGRILGLGGHLHKYGVVLRLEDVTEGKVVWEARPELDEEGNVVGMPTKKFFLRFGRPGLRIHADHLYRLTAVYDNPTGETIPEGAMGTLGGVFIPDDGQEWPALDREHPEFALDWKLSTEGAPPPEGGAAGQGGHAGHGGHGAHGGTHGGGHHH